MTRRTASPEAQLVRAARPSGQLPGLEPAGRSWPLAVADGALLRRRALVRASSTRPPTPDVGTTVRIMYIHVPNAWLSQFVYGVMAVAALGTLVWRHPLADVAAKAAAPLGATFTALALYHRLRSGAGPTWGTFWEWDGRMTSTLLLLLIYLRHHRALARLRRPAARRPHRRHRDAGRRAQHSGHQVLGRLVAHAAPALELLVPGGPRMASEHPDAAAADGARLHPAVPDAASSISMRTEILRAPRHQPRTPGRRWEPADARSRTACRLHHLGLCRRRASPPPALIAWVVDRRRQAQTRLGARSKPRASAAAPATERGTLDSLSSLVLPLAALVALVAVFCAQYQPRPVAWFPRC